MDITEFITTLGITDVNTNVTFIAILVIGIMSLIQISPIKINPWSWIASAFGKAINKDVVTEIKGIKKEIDDLKEGREEDKKERQREKATAARRRILDFDDELRRCIPHSEEAFNNLIEEDIDFYVPFCAQHTSDYSNKKAEAAIAHVLEVYKKCKAENNFI